MVECVEQTLGLAKVPEVTLAYQSLDKQEARLMSTWPEKVTESPNHLDQDFPVSNHFCSGIGTVPGRYPSVFSA